MFVLKRKEPVEKAVRRSARERLDRMLAALSTDPVDRGRIKRDAERVLALLALVSPVMDRTALQRERRSLRSVVRRCSAPPNAQAVLAAFLDRHAGDKRVVGVNPEHHIDAKTDEPPGTRPKKQRDTSPDPTVHRLIADVSEARMRAGYWHLTADGWDALAPGLRTAYTRARRACVTAGHTSDVADADKLADALDTLALQVRWLERLWPDVMIACRVRLGALCSVCYNTALDSAWLHDLNDRPEAKRLRALHAEQTTAWHGRLRREAAALFSETPQRFVDRHAGYWSAWRGESI